MLKQKKYSSFDFLSIPIMITPLQAGFTIIYTLFNALMPAYQTIVIANFIDTSMNIFNGKLSMDAIILPIVLILVYIVFTNLLPSIANLVSLSGKNKFSMIFKGRILEKRSSLEYLHIENTETQELINRATTDAADNFWKGFNNIMNGATIVISSISLLAIIFSYNILSCIAIIIVSIPLFIVAMKTGAQNYNMSKEVQNIQRKYRYLSSVLIDREYACERNLFGYSGELQKEFDNLYIKSNKIESRIEWKSYINMKSGSLVTLLIVAAIVAMLLPSLHNGVMSLGIFVALTNAIFSIIQGMSWRLSDTMSEYSRLNEYLKDFTKFVFLSEKKDSGVVKINIDEFRLENIKFDNVSFKYPGTDHYILKGCSFILDADKNYAFVGENGAGKSTIIKLLVGLYDNFEGDILINEKSIRKYDYATIKSIVSVVFQDFTQFYISVKDNVIIGDSMKEDDDKVLRILSELEFEEKNLQEGINTYLGKVKSNSVDVSGGQWQRLAIARLLYSNAKINILDEPTASLDPVAESKIYEQFSRLNNDRFTVYITHRLGAARIADEILVLSGGQISEKGSHTELMRKQNGLYKQMFESQKSWYDNERN